MTRKMRINEAKAYVAERLGIDRIDLTNEDVMRGLREDLGIGTVVSVAGSPKGIRAKRNVAKLLGINIRSVDLFDSK